MPEKTSRIGEYFRTAYGDEEVHAYLPRPLPPDPPIEVGGFLILLEEANQSIGRLDGLAAALPDPRLFLYTNIRKEAVLSSQIEGTQSSLSDLLFFESDVSPTATTDDLIGVSNYVGAMEHGLRRIREGFPLSLPLVKRNSRHPFRHRPWQ